MAKSASIESARDHNPPVVELRVEAHPDQLAVLRAVAAAIALQHDFDLDTVADVKLAVDEAATRLIMGAPEDAILACSFRAALPLLHISLSAPTNDASAIGQPRSFGWHVLNSLTESISVTSDDSRATIDMSIAEGSADR
ncbi:MULTISPECIES: anti-sigma factor [Rhodococcus]|nr:MULTISPECIES: anti-sigma factor [Rhodococcus]APE10306.1 anti-sigma factor [Rhodococcus sp. 2G]AYA23647.1 ATP-binding protein [Rhodococcus rhodochrous]MCD2097130.1 ATP-binding protein [Rhodococcus rhodochrous]MCD2120438.1 ATP-binding protein [Rhodococcus rhodochrous]MCQ4133090.1 ATP-binding protein [Rhodococcus rhodochrous]